jgi:hypothetical protein
MKKLFLIAVLLALCSTSIAAPAPTLKRKVSDISLKQQLVGVWSFHDISSDETQHICLHKNGKCYVNYPTHSFYSVPLERYVSYRNYHVFGRWYLIEDESGAYLRLELCETHPTDMEVPGEYDLMRYIRIDKLTKVANPK